MQLFVVLSSLVPPSVLSSAATIRWQEMHSYALRNILLSGSPGSLATIPAVALYRVPDVVIGLSCLAISVTLIAFIIAAGKLLPFRIPFIALAVIVTLCGFTHMTAAVLPSNPHVWLAAYLSFLAALLALVIACVLPFLLPYALRILRALPDNEAAQPPFPSSLSIAPALAAALTPSPTPAPVTIPSPAPTPVPAPAPTPAPASPPAPAMAATPIQPAPISPQQADARFIAATETSLDAFFIFAPLRGSDGKVEDFTFTWLNQNGEKLLSKPRKEILGARLTQLLPIDAEPKSLDHYRLVLLTGKPYIHEFPLKEDDVYSTWMRHHVVKLEDGIAITVTDITERRHTEQYLLHLTQHDALTGLPTRALLDDRIAQAIARANRYRTKVAVFLIGVESSSPITEPHDRSVQDDITVITANRLRSAIRSTDSIIRLGGDEFVVVMTDISLTSDIRRAAATLVAVLSPSIAVEDQEIPITCTLGVSIYPDTAATIQDLLSGADVAMYRAQTQGENQYVLFTPASEDDAQECAD